jgi:hypothetical protein
MKGEIKMKRILMPVLTLALLVGSLIQIPVSLAGDFEGNGSCESCLEDAQEKLEQCEATWDYGRGDPDCQDKYQQMVIHCQLTVCIY